MSDASSFNRWFIVTVAVVVGFLIGIAFAIYLGYAWVPSNIILRDAPPRYLRFDAAGESPQYRDVYVARVATRYVESGETDAALVQAQQALGVATGDATPIEALAMARSAEQAARIENLSASEQGNPDVGWFTLADQNNLSLLANRLELVKDQPATVAQSVVDARRNAAIYGLVLLLLWVALLGGLLLLVANWLKPEPAVVTAPQSTVSPDDLDDEEDTSLVSGPVVTTTTTTTQKTIRATSDQPLPPVAAPTEPGLVAPVQAPVALRVASPVVGETLINTFHTSYEHGDERYDEGFQVSSLTGELIGECGASIADRANLSSPARVTALAIWVFDKNDFQSTNKVLLTPYAYSDDVMRSKLAARGDVVRAQPGMMFEVNTSTLRVEVAVRNLRMQPIDTHPDGYFERVDLDFRVFKKP